MAEPHSNSVWKLIQDLNTKRGITEIVINNPKTVFVERGGQFIQLSVNLSKKDLLEFVHDLADFNKKVCDAKNPILDGNLPDGSRVNIILEPYAKGSPAVTIRKYLREISTFEKNPNIFGLNEKWVSFFIGMVKAKMNIIVSGGTGVGKTTFLNLLLQEMNSIERVVTIEDTLELSFNIPNLVKLEARSKGKNDVGLSTQDLVKNTLRMRPDRIIIGETRGGELFDLLQAMNTGHEGSMSSVHSNSPGECLSRMETLFLLSGHDVPYHVVRRQISTAVDFIVQLSRNREGKRIVTSLVELTGMEGDNIQSQTIGKWEEGEFKETGIPPKNMDRIHTLGGVARDYFL